MTLSTELRNKVHDLRNQGYTIEEINKIYGLKTNYNMKNLKLNRFAIDYSEYKNTLLNENMYATNQKNIFYIILHCMNNGSNIKKSNRISRCVNKCCENIERPLNPNYKCPCELQKLNIDKLIESTHTKNSKYEITSEGKCFIQEKMIENLFGL